MSDKTVKKYHFIQWNITQHDADPGIRELDAISEHVWRKMCDLMQMSEEVGFLIVAGKPTSLEVIAKYAKVAVHQLRSILKRLSDLKIYSRDQRGVIFCRRMIRDEQYRRKAAKFGSQGYKKSQAQGEATTEKKPSKPRGVKSHGGADKILWNGHYWFPDLLEKVLAEKITEVNKLTKKPGGLGSHNVSYI